jgi:hypothetical protein
MTKRSLITPTEDEWAHLLALTKKGTVSARQLTRAHILLQADAGDIYAVIAAAFLGGLAIVERVRKRFVEEDLEGALREGPGPRGWCKLDGKQEAFLITLASSTPLEGRTSWTMP